MATFTYVARDAGGASLRGQVVAASPTEAAQRLRREGKFIVRLDEAGAVRDVRQVIEAGGSRRVRKADLIFLCAQLSLMLDSGVPVAEALEGIIRQSPPGALKRVLTDVRRRVESGEPLSDSLSRHPRVFTPFFVNLIRAAEMSGRLGETFERIGAYLANQRDIATRVRGALTYPVVLLVLAIGVVIFLMTYMLPKFTTMYAGKEDMLPAATKFVVGVSNWLTNYWPWWTGGIVASVIGATVYFRTAPGRRVGHWILLNLPILGRMMRKAALTRSLHTLGTLIGSGVSMLDAVAITRRVVGNHYYEQMWDDVSREIQRGQQLSTALLESPIFPRPLAQTIEAGERSGEIGSVMQRISDWVERDLKEGITSATRLIEPLMIIVVGSIVGTIAAAMLLPIFSIARTLR